MVMNLWYICVNILNGYCLQLHKQKKYVQYNLSYPELHFQIFLSSWHNLQFLTFISYASRLSGSLRYTDIKWYVLIWSDGQVCTVPILWIFNDRDKKCMVQWQMTACREWFPIFTIGWCCGIMFFILTLCIHLVKKSKTVGRVLVVILEGCNLVLGEDGRLS